MNTKWDVLRSPRFGLDHYPSLCANIYGWAKGPTHPRPVSLTSALLDTITKEIILSRNGPRVVMGDLNIQQEDTYHAELWQSHGWVEIQSWAAIHHQRPITLTSKGATQLDFVWVSPELVPYLHQVQAWDLFSDHSVIGAELHLPLASFSQNTWYMPSFVPWSQVNFDSWHGSNHASIPIPPDADPTETFADFSRRYEASFEGHVSTPDERLPPACHGRGQTQVPQAREAVFPTLRPSRPGEVSQPTDFLGRTAQRWFLQLRRLQSMRHALRAGKMTEDAILYRLELWKAIQRAPGFGTGFTSWWRHRPVQLQGSPEELLWWVPGLAMCERIFDDYQVNYKKLEGWHVRHRQSLLEVTLQTQRSRIFKLTRPEGKSSLSHLEDTKEVTVLAQSDNGDQLHVSEPLVVQPPFQSGLRRHESGGDTD